MSIIIIPLLLLVGGVAMGFGAYSFVLRLGKRTEQPSPNTEACERVMERCLKAFRKEHLTVEEILLTLGNLSYSMGASIEGHQGAPGPTVREVMEAFKKEGRVGQALMLQGVSLVGWIEDLKKGKEQQEASK